MKFVNQFQFPLSVYLTSGILFTVTHGMEGPGSLCQITEGLQGRCEEISTCLDYKGAIKFNDTIHMCDRHQGKLYACCRKSEAVAEQCK